MYRLRFLFLTVVRCCKKSSFKTSQNEKSMRRKCKTYNFFGKNGKNLTNNSGTFKKRVRQTNRRLKKNK